MSAPQRLLGFVAGLAVIAVVALTAGRLLDPGAPAATRATAPHGTMAAMDAVRGLAVADHGLRLQTLTPAPRAGRPVTLRFRVLDDAGRPVRAFELTHTKRMHLILVRRDLTGFQHLHPAMAPDGTWSVRARLGAPGSYRLLADFRHDGRDTTLADDLRVDGDARLRALPAATTTATSAGGYRVTLAARAPHRGEESDLTFAVTRRGRPVAVEPYLGAMGHLVALREGDLAFLHVHPSGGALRFASTFPTAGGYRLFLQFKVGGRVRTVAFTREVA